MANLISTTN